MLTLLPLPDAQVGQPYGQQVGQATGGSPPYSYTLETANGFPPIGLHMDASGFLSGTLSVGGRPGTYTFGVCAVDMVGAQNCGKITVVVTPKVKPSGGYDGSYSGPYTLTSPNGTDTGTGTFTVTNGQFTDPYGVFIGTVDSTGHFTGNWNYTGCATCLPLPMSGKFSTSAPFILSGNIGTTSRGSFTLHKQ